MEKDKVSLEGVLHYIEDIGDPGEYAGIISRILRQHPGLLIEKEVARMIRKSKIDKSDLFRHAVSGRGKGIGLSSDTIRDERQCLRIFTSKVPR